MAGKDARDISLEAAVLGSQQKNNNQNLASQVCEDWHGLGDLPMSWKVIMKPLAYPKEL